MAERVDSAKEVSLNAIRYPIEGEVRSFVTSQYPAKIVTGDTSRESVRGVSVLAFNDWSGGWGQEKMDGVRPTNQYYRATTIGSITPNQLVCAPLRTQTTDPSLNGSINELVSHEGQDLLLGTWSGGTSVRSLGSLGGSWSANLHTLPAAATDSISVRMGGSEYAIWATTGGYTYTADASSFTDTDDTIFPTKYLTFWDDKLWGIDATGQLWYASTIGTGVDDAQLQLPDNSVNALFTGPDAGGTEIIYAATRKGLYAHDVGNARFIKTEVRYAHHDNAGLGAISWGNSIYIPVGRAIYEYTPSTGTVRDIAPRELPSVVGDTWNHLEEIPYGLIGVLDSLHAPNIGGAVFLYNGIGWTAVGSGVAATAPVDSAHATSLFGSFNMFFAHNSLVYYVDIPDHIFSPQGDVGGQTYQGGILRTPWFDAGQNEVDKLGLRLHTEVHGAGANETVIPGYRVNYSTGGFTDFSAITSDGTTTNLLNSADGTDGTTPDGRPFMSIQFQLVLSTGTNTLTPTVRSLEFEYRKNIDPKWGFTFTVIVPTQGYADGRSAREMRSNLVAAVESNSLMELTFRNDDTSGDPLNYYVDIIEAVGLENTGEDYTQHVQLTCVEL